MEILWWLAPAAVVTVTTMLWVGWRGRAGRPADRERAARRLGAALARAGRGPGHAAPRPPADRATGVAVRRTGPRPAADEGNDRRAC